MATKASVGTLGGVHTAGIYADMTVDGPEIGTLVVVIDRAKNLPNRKTMGKQDPYCAARLGKEAKKTETDKRGGQTPKWDQELRFTVHDSPDYYQLKVSVFNDDRKTELIGETWVALDQIIVPGGGQNDLWHSLNCKGKYAGDIRIEITYYDIRPRDEKVEARRNSAPVINAADQSSGGISGPRQLKPVKRRPLPADPTSSAHSSTLSYTPPTSVPQLLMSQQRYVESPNDFIANSMSPLARPNQILQDGQQGGSSLTHNNQHPEVFNTVTSMAPSPYQSVPDQPPVYDTLVQDNLRQDNNSMLNQSPQNPQPYNQPSSYDTEYGNAWQSTSSVQTGENFKSMIHSNSSPTIIDARPRQHAPAAGQYRGSSPPKLHSYDESPASQYSRTDGYSTWPAAEAGAVEECAAPPPPPVHRTSALRSSLPSQGRAQSEPYTLIPASAPLDIKAGRGSVGGSPLVQVHSNSSCRGYESMSPSESQSCSNPAPSISSRTSYGQLGNTRSQSPDRDYGQVPPSLVPGYEPSVADGESERIMHEHRLGTQQRHSDHQLPQYQQAAAPIVQMRPHPTHQYHQAPASSAQAVPQPTPHDLQNIRDRHSHRSSVPNVKPRTVSPDPRTPVRKSLSPQPGSAQAGRRQSGVPFSPDSFDAFNPSLVDANVINQSGVTYNTPEQAKDAYREHERQKKLGDGPIVGSDGRIIDPSDHLPTDTWAPEPEPKKPTKGPEVTLRFRHSPRGAQPLPAGSRPPVSGVRSHTTTTPIYAHAADNSSPNSGGRNRLQKKSHAAVAQPASSPTVPTLNTTPRSSPLRSATSDYPLRERENYGGCGSSPTYVGTSSGNMPPPLPGKLPIHGGQEDWGMSALSEEMKRIDLGVTVSQGRNRRSRYGL